MEEIIGLVVVIIIGILKFVNEKYLNAGKQPESPSQPFGPLGSGDPSGGEPEVFVPKAEPVAPKPIEEKPAYVRPMSPKPSTVEVVQRQTKTRKPILIEEEEKSPKEEIDPKKLVLYSEIMTPKFNE
ncbi:MAG: hypothetical protein IKZ08_05230 [Bacteroidales bacterium]|nr:hypothetical protein [Bacteroidales bacterium]